MESRSEGLIEALRDARTHKGLSQRDLSQKAGITQAHLSRIESGAVDLKLSTFLELARLLDLEPVLAPRTALSAVKAVVREADANREVRSVRGAANLLQQLVRSLRLEHPREPLVDRMADQIRELHALEPLIRTPRAVAELNDITSQIREGDLTGLKRAVERLKAFRNGLVHQVPETDRPAYSLDNED